MQGDDYFDDNGFFNFDSPQNPTDESDDVQEISCNCSDLEDDNGLESTLVYEEYGKTVAEGSCPQDRCANVDGTEPHILDSENPTQ